MNEELLKKFPVLEHLSYEDEKKETAYCLHFCRGDSVIEDVPPIKIKYLKLCIVPKLTYICNVQIVDELFCFRCQVLKSITNLDENLKFLTCRVCPN